LQQPWFSPRSKEGNIPNALYVGSMAIMSLVPSSGSCVPCAGGRRALEDPLASHAKCPLRVTIYRSAAINERQIILQKLPNMLAR
jgi:hypothetical protein